MFLRLTHRLKRSHFNFNKYRYFNSNNIYCVTGKEIGKEEQCRILEENQDLNLITYSRIMMPQDANLAGNVHGGTVMKMMEQASTISATRHVNSNPNDMNAYFCALARMYKMNFIAPMYVGEVASLAASVTFVSNKTVKVDVTVYAENLLTGEQRLTNKGEFIYVSFLTKNFLNKSINPPKFKTYSVPRLKLDNITLEQETKYNEEYQLAKSTRSNNNFFNIQYEKYKQGKELIQLMSYQDVNSSNIVYGGVILKLMDTVSGIVGYNYCKTNVVTAFIDNVDFLYPIFKGKLKKLYIVQYYNLLSLFYFR